MSAFLLTENLKLVFEEVTQRLTADKIQKHES